jgi:hypothetical protein
MSSRAPRRTAALVVMVIAGLASMATSYPGYSTLEFRTSGETLVGGDTASTPIGMDISGRDLMPLSKGSLTLVTRASYTMELDGSSPPPRLDLPIEARLITASDEDPQWSPVPVRVEVSLADCVPSCRRDLVLELRQVSPALGDLIVRWDLVFAVSEFPTFGAERPVSFDLGAPSLESTQIAFVGAGAALGLLAAAGLWAAKRLTSRSRGRENLDPLWSFVLVGVGVVLAVEAAITGIPKPLAATLLVIIGGAGLIPLLLGRYRRSVPAGTAAALAVGFAGFMVGSVVSDVFRLLDVAWVVAVTTGSAAVLPVLALPYLQQHIDQLARSGWRTRLVSALAIVASVLMLVVQFYQPAYGMLAVVIIVCAVAWLHGIPGLLSAMAGLVAPLAALMTVPIDLTGVLRNLGPGEHPQRYPDFLLEVNAALGVFVLLVALAILSILPPTELRKRPAVVDAPPA